MRPDGILRAMNYYKNKPLTVSGLIMAGLCIFIWGITFVSTKYLLKSFTSFEILLGRFVTAYAGLWLLYPRPMRMLLLRHEFLFLGAGFFGVTCYQFLENIAIHYSTASNVSIIVSITPIFTALTAQLFLKEKHITPRFCLGFVIAIFGIALVSFNGTAVLKLNPKGDLLALGATISWGFYSVFVSRINALGYKTLPATRRIFFYAVLCMLPLVIIGLRPELRGDMLFGIAADPELNIRRLHNPLNWLNMLFLGFAASAFCFAAWSFACHALGTVRVTIGIYLVPVITVVFAYFTLHEPITLMGTVGTALTIAGLLISAQRRQPRIKQ